MSTAAVLLGLTLIYIPTGEVIDQQIAQVGFESLEECGQYVTDFADLYGKDVTWFDDLSWYFAPTETDVEAVTGQCFYNPNNKGI